MKGRSSKRMRRLLASVNVMDPSEFEGGASRGPSSKKQRLTTIADGTTSYTPETLPPPPPLVLSPEFSISNEEESEGDADSVDEEEDSDVSNEEELDGESDVSNEEELDGETETVADEDQTANQLEVTEDDSIGQQAVVTETLSNARKPTLILPDPDLLDCPICFEILKIPIYQCENGHIACASCCVNMDNKCPSCSCTIGRNRCRAVEKILEAVEVSCGNAIHGCDHMIKYCGSCAHESLCIYAPCFCPIDDCSFVASAWDFYKHFHAKHSSMTFSFSCRFTVYLDSCKTRIFLREDTIDAVFVLSNSLVNDTRILSVVLIAPKSHMRKYRCELEAKDEETSLTLQSSVESVTKLADDHKPTRYLVVNFNNRPQGKLELVICIHQHGC